MSAVTDEGIWPGMLAVTGERGHVAVSGELDLFTFTRLHAAVRCALDEGFTEVVVDLSGVAFIDAMSAESLLSLRAEAVRRRASVVLKDPSGPVRRVWSLLHPAGTPGPQPSSRWPGASGSAGRP